MKRGVPVQFGHQLQLSQCSERALLPERGVRGVEKIDRMYRARAHVRANQTGSDLHQAARISGRYPGGSRRANVGEFWREHGVGRIRLDEVVDARAAAALIRVVQRYELQLRDGGEYRQRRLGHTLRMLQVTRRVVGDLDRKRPT